MPVVTSVSRSSTAETTPVIAQSTSLDTDSLALPKASFTGTSTKEVHTAEERTEAPSLKYDGEDLSFEESAARLRGLGYSVNIKADTFVSDIEDPLSEIGDQHHRARELRTATMCLGVPAELRTDIETVSLTPFELRTTPLADGTVSVELLDHLSPEREVLLQKTLSLPSRTEDATSLMLSGQVRSFLGMDHEPESAELTQQGEVRTELLDEVASIVAERAKIHNQALAAIPPQEGSATQTVKGISILEQTDEALASDLQQRLKNVANLSLVVRPHGDYSERMVVLTPEQLEGKTLLIDGKIDLLKITLCSTEPEKSILSGVIITDIGPDRSPLPTIEKSEDKYGNTILTSNIGGKESVSVIVAGQYAERSQGEELSRPIAIDVATKDIGDISGLFRRTRLESFTTDAGITIYSRDLEDIQSRFEPEKIEAFQSGALRAQALFGMEGMVRGIEIIDSNQANAFYSSVNPNTVVILDDILQQSTEELERVGFHEATHLFDDQLREASQTEVGPFLSSDGEVAEIWREKILAIGAVEASIGYRGDTRETFFSQLNESVFFDRAFGGHSQDSPAELFASFVVSTTHPHWRGKVQSLDASFRTDYANVLQAVQSSLDSSTILPTDAPIRDLLKYRSEQLTKMREGDTDVSIANPGIIHDRTVWFSELSMPPRPDASEDDGLEGGDMDADIK